MSKLSRKIKWKGVALNRSNIDEYMKDLQEETKGQYITQGVSFNKDDNFQMNLLKNSILAHGSFSGFVKHLLYAHFEQKGSIDDSVWQPNEVVEEEKEVKEAVVEQQPSPSPTVELQPSEETQEENTSEETIVEQEPEEVAVAEKPVEKPSDNPTPTTPKQTGRPKKKKSNISAFVTPHDDDE